MDDDDEVDDFVRADIIGELAAKLREKGASDVVDRIARKHRLRSSEVPARLVDEYWRQRAKDLAGSWLDKLTDDEIEHRLWIEQRALEVCKPGEQGECQERLNSTLKAIAVRGGIEPRDPKRDRGRPEVVATQWDDNRFPAPPPRTRTRYGR